MKIFSFIFAFYFLALAITPCNDMPEDVVQNEISTIHQTSGNEHNHQHENENCSPLCACNCCNSQVLSQGTITLKKDTVFYTRKIQTSFQNSFLKDFPSTIWQPPKMS